MYYKDHVLYRNLLTEYRTIERGEGVYLYDTEGKRYLDAIGGANVADIGHGVVEVAEAMAKQAKKIAFVHGSRFRNQPLIDFADLVVKMAPPGLNKVYITPGGTEAIESSIKLIRHYHLGKGQAERYQFISRWHSFHGTTLGSLELTGFGFPGMRRGFGPWLQGFPKIVAPYCYRCPFGKSYPDCDVACADDLERTIQLVGPETIAGFIAEPIIGTAMAGVTPPPEYYPRIREICDEYDVMFIVDEVMVGFGRTGANFAIDHWDVVPDIIAFGKGVSGGYYPLGGFIVHDKIIDVLVNQGDGTFFDGYSHSGEPLSCTVGIAVQEFVKKNKLIERAKEMGTYLQGRLEVLYEKHPSIGDVRGRGLHVGVEFVKDRVTKEPFAAEVGFASRLSNAAMDRGVVLFTSSGFIDGQLGDQLVLCPPLVISKDELDEVIAVLDESLGELEQELL